MITRYFRGHVMAPLAFVASTLFPNVLLAQTAVPPLPPPHGNTFDIRVDTTGGCGLLVGERALVSDGGALPLRVSIRPSHRVADLFGGKRRMRLWLGVRPLEYFEGAAPDSFSKRPVERLLASELLIAPSVSPTWPISFARSESVVVLRVHMTQKAAAVTVFDQMMITAAATLHIPAPSVDDVAGVADDVTAVSAMRRAASRFVPMPSRIGWATAAVRAGSDLLNMSPADRLALWALCKRVLHIDMDSTLFIRIIGSAGNLKRVYDVVSDTSALYQRTHGRDMYLRFLVTTPATASGRP